MPIDEDVYTTLFELVKEGNAKALANTLDMHGAWLGRDDVSSLVSVATLYDHADIATMLLSWLGSAGVCPSDAKDAFLIAVAIGRIWGIALFEPLLDDNKATCCEAVPLVAAYGDVGLLKYVFAAGNDGEQMSTPQIVDAVVDALKETPEAMPRLHMLGNADFGVYAMGGEAAIFTAARLGDVHLVEGLLDAGFDPSAEHNRALQEAALCGSADCLAVLMAHPTTSYEDAIRELSAGILAEPHECEKAVALLRNAALGHW